MAFPLIQEQVGGDYADAPNTTMDSINAAGEMAASSGPLRSVVDAVSMANIENNHPNQRMMSVPELTAKYPGVPWTEPKKELVAKYIADAHADRDRLANRINTGGGGIAGSLGRFAVGTMTGLGDPVGLAAGGAIGYGFRATGMLAEGGLPIALARGAAEGASVMTPLEVAHLAHERAMENDVSLSDSIQNVAIGSLVGAGLEGAFHGLKDGKAPTKLPPEYSPPPLGNAAKPEHNAQLIDIAAKQIEEGLKPNVEPLVQLHEDQRQGRVQSPVADYSGRTDYEFSPIDTNEPVSRQFYHGNTSGNENFNDLNFSENVNSQIHLGDGVYLNDNAMKANGYAEKGLVHSVETKGAKLFSIDEPMSRDQVSKILHALNPEVEESLDETIESLHGHGVTLRDLYEDLDHEQLNKANEVLAAEGYDGLHFDDYGKDGDNLSNGAMLFDKKDAHQNGIFNSDPRLITELSEEAKAALTGNNGDHSKEMNYDPQHAEGVASLLEESNQEKPGKMADIADTFKIADNKLKAMESAGMLKPEHIEEWNEINGAMNERLKETEGVVKSMFDCIAAH